MLDTAIQLQILRTLFSNLAEEICTLHKK